MPVPSPRLFNSKGSGCSIKPLFDELVKCLQVFQSNRGGNSLNRQIRIFEEILCKFKTVSLNEFLGGLSIALLKEPVQMTRRNTATRCQVGDADTTVDFVSDDTNGNLHRRRGRPSHLPTFLGERQTPEKIREAEIASHRPIPMVVNKKFQILPDPFFRRRGVQDQWSERIRFLIKSGMHIVVVRVAGEMPSYRRLGRK